MLGHGDPREQLEAMALLGAGDNLDELVA